MGRDERRAISVQLDRVTSGQLRAVEDYEVSWSTKVTGDDLSNSQPDRAASIPVIRSEWEREALKLFEERRILS